MNYENLTYGESLGFMPKTIKSWIEMKPQEHFQSIFSAVSYAAREAYRAGVAESAIKPASKTIAVLSIAHQNDILEKACKSTAFSISDFERIADGLNGVIRGAINIAYAQGMDSMPRAEEPDPERVMNFTVNPQRSFQSSTLNYAISLANLSDYELRVRVVEVGPQKCDPLDSDEFHNLFWRYGEAIQGDAYEDADEIRVEICQFIRERFTPK